MDTNYQCWFGFSILQCNITWSNSYKFDRVAVNKFFRFASSDNFYESAKYKLKSADSITNTFKEAFAS